MLFTVSLFKFYGNIQGQMLVCLREEDSIFFGTPPRMDLVAVTILWRGPAVQCAELLCGQRGLDCWAKSVLLCSSLPLHWPPSTIKLGGLVSDHLRIWIICQTLDHVTHNHNTGIQSHTKHTMVDQLGRHPVSEWVSQWWFQIWDLNFLSIFN